ncbi:hypothetical protein HHK36_006430 [Tetracentron sinense]|uniref:Uncharacterized protein n=1 Tax=Tetracentron sinense TaxID=13715 RepID=A0A834ZLI9_TETSI|nr:hypothetical protein HHK36_006430 [Tetracentron sinense]
MAVARATMELSDLAGTMPVLEGCRKVMSKNMSAQVGDRLCVALDAELRMRKVSLQGQLYVHWMCSNTLALIKNMIDTDIVNERLLQSSVTTPDVIVVADESRDYEIVSVAVAVALEKSSKRDHQDQCQCL